MPDLLTQLPTGHAQAAELTESERYRILGNDHRRLVLDILSDHAAGIGLGELAERVVDRIDDLTSGQTTAKRVATTLHHKHLPMLDDYDIVDYDQDGRWVQLQ